MDHTPGPWTLGAKYRGSVDGYPVFGFPISASGQAIARVHAGSVTGFGFGNEEANARLIAAAPEMLALLVEMECDLTHMGAQGQPLKRIRALIAKAKGAK